jgi:aminoglycoside 3-N-acetyltransferase I
MTDPRTAAGDDAAATPAADVRVLDAGDARVLRDMLYLLGRVFDDPRSYVDRQPDEAYLARLLARDTFVAVAACANGRVVGGIAGYVLPKFEQERSELYIYDLGVDPAHRRRGIATAMIECLRHYAARRGIHVIYVQADAGDDPAIALYTRLGTREDVLHFDILPVPRAT